MNKIEYQTLYSLVALDPVNEVIPLPMHYHDKLPLIFKNSIDQIIGSDSAIRKSEKLIWEGAKVNETKYYKITQEENIVIESSSWKCKDCDLKDNIWLCLTCGSIGCGRKFFDGSGGNNHGVEHYEKTYHPLVVKLGTILPDGTADVFSYPEKEMVKDPLLVQHLAHFGIDVKNSKKTSKTMMELELDQNFNFESSRIEATGKSDKPLFGPGLTGLKNFGNTCYMASVLQAFFAIPEVVKRYKDEKHSYFLQTSNKPTNELEIQLTKVCNAMVSGEYSKNVNEGNDKKKKRQNGIAPKMLKQLMGRNHVEFSTMRQQDALEFFQYLVTTIQRNEKRIKKYDVTSIFKFKLEDRIQCSQSNCVKYSYGEDFVFSVPVNLNKVKNSKEYSEFIKKDGELKKQFNLQEQKKYDEALKNKLKYKKAFYRSKLKPVRPLVKMIDCFNAASATSVINGFYSSAIDKKTNAYKTTKLATFPDYLVVQLRRFFLDGFLPKKINASILETEKLDLSSLKGKGKQDNEKSFPKKKKKKSEPKKPFINQNIVSTLMGMGFTKNACEKAAHFTGNSNADTAANWLFGKLDDPDLNKPLKLESKDEESDEEEEDPKSKIKPKDEDLKTLKSMGFTEEEGTVALQNTENNLSRAIEWIFNHQSELKDMIANKGKKGKKSEKKYSDGEGKYELASMIAHIGSNTSMGHYVCFVKMDKQWVKFNDSVVESCENPPLDMGYIYIYKRVK